jgi:hypothetical protein
LGDSYCLVCRLVGLFGLLFGLLFSLLFGLLFGLLLGPLLGLLFSLVVNFDVNRGSKYRTSAVRAPSRSPLGAL